MPLVDDSSAQLDPRLAPRVGLDLALETGVGRGIAAGMGPASTIDILPQPGSFKMSVAGHDGMEELSIAECQHRLREGGVGILALCGVEAPVLRPVNFALHDGWILIRTGEGQILEAATGVEPASFAITELDRFEHTGWSVVVTGKLTPRSHLDGVEQAPVRPWIRSEKPHFVGLSMDRISGRRIADPVETR